MFARGHRFWRAANRGRRSCLAGPIKACAQLHLHWMPATMTIEDFFPTEDDLHRATKLQSELGGDDLVTKDVRLAAKAATVRAGDHLDLRRL